MIGRAVVTTPRPQGLGLDQKSACRKNQNNVLAYGANLIDRPVSIAAPGATVRVSCFELAIDLAGELFEGSGPRIVIRLDELRFLGRSVHRNSTAFPARSERIGREAGACTVQRAAKSASALLRLSR